MPARKALSGSLGEVVAVWVLLALVAVEILITYARVPPRDLYHVSHSGLAGGASRALVFSNYPVALVTIAILGVLVDRRTTRGATLALLSTALCAIVFAPGVVDQANLDAKPVNAAAAIGVALALVLTVAAARRIGTGWAPAQPGDRVRVAVLIALLLAAPPWAAADLGFSLAGVPVLGSLYQTGELRRQPGERGVAPAVHLGHHHGMDGVLLVLSALALTRTLPTMRRLQGPLTIYLALMFAYGVANSAQDFWLEQAVKRGWTSWQLPMVIRPQVSWGWAVLVASAVALAALLSRLPGARTTPLRSR